MEQKTADKRTVHTDALETLGKIINETQARDAIHLAVEPVVAAVRLHAGDHVGLLPDGRAATSCVKLVGIVDPFLNVRVNPGDRFWLVVYPRMITSLRHVWEHPDFKKVADVPVPKVEDVPVAKAVAVPTPYPDLETSKQWIRDYADRMDVTYDRIMSYARSHCGDGWGDYLVDGGRWEGQSTDPEFWRHFTIVTGLVPNDGESTNFFSCSC